jgi:hypothetical protein
MQRRKASLPLTWCLLLLGCGTVPLLFNHQTQRGKQHQQVRTIGVEPHSRTSETRRAHAVRQFPDKLRRGRTRNNPALLRWRTDPRKKLLEKVCAAVLMCCMPCKTAYTSHEAQQHQGNQQSCYAGCIGRWGACSCANHLTETLQLWLSCCCRDREIMPPKQHPL